MTQMTIDDITEPVQQETKGEKRFSVGYYDYDDRLFWVTVPAPNEETARQKVRDGRIRHQKSRGYLRILKVNEINRRKYGN